MSRASLLRSTACGLRLLLAMLLLACAPLQARTLQARIARVATTAATLEGVGVRLHWPEGAQAGELSLTARLVDADHLGYRFRDLHWTCPLRRDGHGGWACEGAIRSRGGAPSRLALALGPASTDAVLSRGDSRLAVRRDAATPDFTSIDLVRVPAAWAQALLDRAWQDARLTAGSLDGELVVRSPSRGPLRVDGTLSARGLALETADATIAAEDLGGRFDLDYRDFGDRALASIDGALRGGEFLAGNTYVSLPDTPVAVQLDAEQAAGAWRLPRFSWRDGEVLVAEGSAELGTDAALRHLDLRLHSGDLAPATARYLSGWLGLAGLGDLELAGGFDADVRVANGTLHAVDARLHGIDARDPRGRFRFDDLAGTPRFSAGAPVAGELRWSGGELYGLAFGAGAMPIDSHGGELRLREAFAVPMLGGALRFEGLSIRPPAAGQGATVTFALDVENLDIGELAQALGWPEFRGSLSGHIPSARYAGDRLVFDGGLSMDLFDGTVAVSSLALERPFGTAPSLTADVDLDDIDLLALTGVFDFGSITGRLDGRVHDLRLVDWTATAFDAELRTDRKRGVRQRISQRAVRSISSVGDGTGVALSGIQGMLIGFFDDFGYGRLGISCRLANEVCEMGGLRSAGNTFTIVEGAGLPRLTVIGHNRLVDWPTLIERLAAVGKGEVKPVVD
jgi:hypothetical protein